MFFLWGENHERFAAECQKVQFCFKDDLHDRSRGNNRKIDYGKRL